MAEDASSGGWSTIESDEVSHIDCSRAWEIVQYATQLTNPIQSRAFSHLLLNN